MYSDRSKMKKNGTRCLQRAFHRLRNTPLHPQWLAFIGVADTLLDVKRFASGTIIDIGCGDRGPEGELNPNCVYIGMDLYQTATEWYDSKPDVYGDAQNLPFRDRTADCVLLLDVLEHLPDPEKCIGEVQRVLAPEGKVILQVPFLYPLHDVPLDFTRWTFYGLRRLTQDHGFDIVESKHIGTPVETAALLLNIALTKSVIDWLRGRHPAAILIFLLPVLVVIVNLAAWGMAKLSLERSLEDGFMPQAYRLVLKRT